MASARSTATPCPDKSGPVPGALWKEGRRFRVCSGGGAPGGHCENANFGCFRKIMRTPPSYRTSTGLFVRCPIDCSASRIGARFMTRATLRDFSSLEYLFIGIFRARSVTLGNSARSSPRAAPRSSMNAARGVRIWMKKYSRDASAAARQTSHSQARSSPSQFSYPDPTDRLITVVEAAAAGGLEIPLELLDIGLTRTSRRRRSSCRHSWRPRITDRQLG